MAEALTHIEWDTKEDAYLIRLKDRKLNNKTIADILGRTETSIVERLIQLRDKQQDRHGMAWTSEEDTALLDGMENDEFCDVFKRGRKEANRRRFSMRNKIKYFRFRGELFNGEMHAYRVRPDHQVTHVGYQYEMHTNEYVMKYSIDTRHKADITTFKGELHEEISEGAFTEFFEDTVKKLYDSTIHN